MSVRMYFNRYNRYNPNKWIWQPYIYAHNCSFEEQREWNDLYLRCRGRRDGKDKVIPDFTSIEKDADQFGRREVTFTDIFGLKWSGRKGAEEEVGSPDYEGHLYYWDEDDTDCEEEALVSDYDDYDNPPDPKVFHKFKVGYPRWRNEYIDIANIDNAEYHYFVENHLFKDSRIEIHYEGEDELLTHTIYDCHDFAEFIFALQKFGKADLEKKLYSQIDEHFEALKNSEREDEREYWPGCTAEDYFSKIFLERAE